MPPSANVRSFKRGLTSLVNLQEHNQNRADLLTGIWVVRNSEDLVKAQIADALISLDKDLNELSNSSNIKRMLEAERVAWDTLSNKIKSQSEVDIKDAIDALRDHLRVENYMLKAIGRAA